MTPHPPRQRGEAPHHPGDEPRGPTEALAWRFVAGFTATGLVARIAPLLDSGGRLLRQFPTEDGYLMLTIARNIALGHGMSTADGTMPTNGTQPLATYLWALCFWLVGGAKEPGVTLVLIAQLLIACAAGFALYRLAARVLHRRPGGDCIAALAASTWFASPLAVRHTMNCLESGLYVLSILLVLLALLPRPGDQPTGPRFRRWCSIGLLLGMAFWARNDAILLCTAIGLLCLFNAVPVWRGPWPRRWLQLGVAGGATLLVAAPWLIQNWLRFGSIVPVSGRAESLDVAVGANLARVPAALLEYATVVGQIPSDLELNRAIILIGTAVIATLATIAILASRRWSAEERTLAAVAIGFSLLLSLFYGLFFGAGHFVSRYLFPTSPFLAILVSAGALLGGARIQVRTGFPGFMAATGAAMLVVAVGLNVRIYRLGAEHPHFQVVEWVESNVPADTWVGAVQTGTLGFFHDRTVNLDGKVNPEALHARSLDRIPEYVLEKEIPVLADWAGIADWGRLPVLAPHYEVVLRDEARNLAVLRRARGHSRLGS